MLCRNKIVFCFIFLFLKINFSFAENYFKKDKLKFSYQSSFDGFVNTGNLNRLLFSNSTNLVLSRDGVRLPLKINLTYGTQDKIILEKELLIYLNQEFFFNNKMLFFINGIESSNLLKIKNRNVNGIGYGINIYHKNNNELNISDAIIHERTEFNDFLNEVIKNSFRVRLKFKIFKSLLITSESYYQPSFISIKNYNCKTSTSFEFPIIKHTYFRINFDDRYESVIHYQTQKNDFKLTFGITVSN